MKRYLVTGATGFLGVHLTRALSARGDVAVRALARRPADALEGLANVELVRCDVIGERDAFGETVPLAEAMAGCAGVFHLAAMVSRDERDGQRLVRVHVDGTKRMLRAAELGLEVVLVNPSLLLGPGDLRQSSTTDVMRLLFQEAPFVPKGGSRW